MNPLIRNDLFPTFFFTTFILFGHEVKGSFFTSQMGMLARVSHLFI